MENENSNIIVRQAEESDLEALIEFNKIAYPTRKGIEEFVKYRFKYTPDLVYFIALKNDVIIGQRMMFLQKTIYKDNISKVYWAADLVVREEFRGLGIGKKIFNSMDTNGFYAFSTNIADVTKGFYEEKGFKEFGKFNFYFKPLNILAFSKSLWKMLRKQEMNNHIQLEIKVPEDVYGFSRKKTAAEFIKSNPPLDFSEKLQTYKDEAYYQWRYFYKENRYFCYASKSSFFIFRTIFWKEMKCLVIVDFEGDLNKIYKSIKKIAKDNQFSGLIWATTEPKTKKFLNKKFFINYFSTPVMSNYKDEGNIAPISFKFSDGDLDFNYSNTPFVYL